MKDSKGWDGKLRVDRAALVTNPEAGEDPDNYSDEDVPPVEQIEADEGMRVVSGVSSCKLPFGSVNEILLRSDADVLACGMGKIDLLEDLENDVEVYMRPTLSMLSLLNGGGRPDDDYYSLGLGYRPCPFPHKVGASAASGAI